MKNLNLIIFTILILPAVSGCEQNKSAASWKLVYQNDLNGESLYGSKENLVSILKQGSPIRVSWGEMLDDGQSCIEFAEPNFTTLMNGPEIVVQYPTSMIQTDYLKSHKSFLNTRNPTEWHALMSTDGHYHQFHSALGSGKVSRAMYLRARMSWYAFTAEDVQLPGQPHPLDTRGGIVLDSIVTLP